MNVILNEIKKEKKPTDNFRINLESDYIQQNLTAYQSVKSRDYPKAEEAYSESVNIAKQLADDYKLSDSLSNLGITEFFNGKLENSFETLQTALTINDQLVLSEKSNAILRLKILSNLCISGISINKTKDSLNYLNQILDILKSEKDSTNQAEYLKSINNCFFRIDSLISYFDINKAFNINGKIIINEDNRNNEEVHKQLIRKVMYNFHKLLRDGDYDSWIKCLNEEKENFKYIHDYNGFLFSTFNQYCAVYAKNPKDLKNAKDAKNKINSVKRILIGNISPETDKDAEKVLIEAKVKLDASIQIYKKLYEFESHLSTKLDRSVREGDDGEEDNYKRDKIFIKIFLRYALNYLNTEIQSLENNTQIRYMTQMKNQIEITMKLVERDQVDLSKIKLFSIDPEISESLKRLFENILYIKYKNNLTSALKYWMRKALGYTSKQEQRQIKSKEFLQFMEKRYKLVIQGK
jgi:tetratricopeptide (TPR) repeat protein